MREQLIQYVQLLFAGTEDSQEIQEEILQNTLDRYDDLVSQGKSPEAAYRLAITGIGDIHEIINGNKLACTTVSEQPATQEEDISPTTSKTLRAVGVALYITCIVPIFLLGNELGLCLMFVMIGIATALMIYSGKTKADDRSHKEVTQPLSPRDSLKRSIRSLITAIGLAVYFIVSFFSGAWFITWVIFPLIGAINGLVSAFIDLKEDN